MTCKDCLSSGVCYKFQNIINGVKTYDEYFNKDVICSDFKDKSKLIELPCKVGDPVCILNPKRVTYADPRFNADIWKLECIGFHYMGIGNKKGYYLICSAGYGLSERVNFEQIGKNVFVGKKAKEEAEQALRD